MSYSPPVETSRTQGLAHKWLLRTPCAFFASSVDRQVDEAAWRLATVSVPIEQAFGFSALTDDSAT